MVQSAPSPEETESLGGLLRAVAGAAPAAGIHFRADDTSEHTSVTFVAYRELLDEARRVRGALRGGRASPGDPVLLLLERPQDFLKAFWGCVLSGLVPCPMLPVRSDVPRWAELLEHARILLGEPLVLTSKALCRELPPLPGLPVAVLEELSAGPADTGDHQAAPDDLALLMLTSGSTKAPKAVRLTHRNLISAMAGKAGRLGLDHRDIVLNWVAFDHVAAFEGHLLPLWCAADQVQVSPEAVLGEPMGLLRLITARRVTHAFAPNFLLGQLARTPVEGESLDLSTLRNLVSGGEAVVTATAERFLDAYAPFGLARDVIKPGFGMTETCAGCVFSPDFPEVDAGRAFASLGLPIEGLEMRVAGSGELQVRGPMVTGGYYNDPEATREAFTPDGWLRTGDLGAIEDGRLRLSGRSKDSVIVNGVCYYSHDLETVLERLDGVRKSWVAAFPIRPEGADTEQLVIVFSPADGVTGDHLRRVLVSIRTATVLRWGFRPVLILPLPEEEIPKTSLGKIPRSVLRRRLEAGRFAAYERRVAELAAGLPGGYAPPEREAERALAEIFADMFELDPGTVGATASFFDLGGTSLDILRLKQRVRERFGIADLPVIWMLRAPTVRGLARRLAADGETDAYDPLVPLQLGGSKTPLFCVHPGVGEVLVFVNLARYFSGERPFYALRARGFGHGEPFFRDFQEMVACYVRAIRERQPSGPYNIAGYSYGGAVAFEIAKALEEAGEHVGFLGILNLPPHINARMAELNPVEGAVNLAFFLSLITKERAAGLADRLRDLPWPQPLEYLIDIAPPERLRELDLDLPKFARWADVAQSLIKAGRSYEPSGSVRSATVFYANPLRGTKQEWLDGHLRKWDRFVREPVRYVEVPGEHYTLMGPEHVTTFQAIFREELNR